VIRIPFTGSALKELNVFLFHKKGTVKMSGKEALFEK
jgi:hypothetical protein